MIQSLIVTILKMLEHFEHVDSKWYHISNMMESSLRAHAFSLSNPVVHGVLISSAVLMANIV